MKPITIALNYLPYILAAVQAVETSIGNTAAGTSKKQIIMSAVQAASATGVQVPETHVALISALIDTTVTALNAAGVFASRPIQVTNPTPQPAPLLRSK